VRLYRERRERPPPAHQRPQAGYHAQATQAGTEQWPGAWTTEQGHGQASVQYQERNATPPANTAASPEEYER